MQSIWIGDLPSVVVIQLDGSEGAQPSIEAEEDVDESAEVDEEDELSTDQIQASKKINSIVALEALCLKPSSLSCMQVPLCRIVRPTLSLDLASLEDDFVLGYREGAVVFHLSTTNEGGQIDKVTNEDLASWDPLWCAVNARFEEFLSSIPRLRDMKGVKFSVCDRNHHRQAWLNVISHLHSTDPSWHYIVDSIVLETQGKLGVVMLAMHDINKYISSTISFMIDNTFVLSFFGHVLNLKISLVIVAQTYKEIARQGEPCAQSLPSSKVWANAGSEI
jgi:hypothetical protein